MKASDKKSIMVKDFNHCCHPGCSCTEGIHTHEVFYGTANRKKSIEDGMVVGLCGNHHNLSNEGVHFNKKFDLYLKEWGEKVWIDTYTDKELPFEDRVQLFIDRFGQNYIDY